MKSCFSLKNEVSLSLKQENMIDMIQKINLFPRVQFTENIFIIFNLYFVFCPVKISKHFKIKKLNLNGNVLNLDLKKNIAGLTIFLTPLADVFSYFRLKYFNTLNYFLENKQ